MFNNDVTISKEHLNEFVAKMQDLLDFVEENKIPIGLAWGMLSFGFTKVAVNA